jgi:hypothetical protein
MNSCQSKWRPPGTDVMILKNRFAKQTCPSFLVFYLTVTSVTLPRIFFATGCSSVFTGNLYHHYPTLHIILLYVSLPSPTLLIYTAVGTM